MFNFLQQQWFGAGLGFIRPCLQQCLKMEFMRAVAMAFTHTINLHALKPKPWLKAFAELNSWVITICGLVFKYRNIRPVQLFPAVVAVQMLMLVHLLQTLKRIEAA